MFDETADRLATADLLFFGIAIDAILNFLREPNTTGWPYASSDRATHAFFNDLLRHLS